MTCEYELRVMRIHDEISGLPDPQGFVDIWAHVRGIEQRFNLVQGEYELRFLRMHDAIARCKRQSQTSDNSRYSSDNLGGSLSAPRY